MIMKKFIPILLAVLFCSFAIGQTWHQVGVPTTEQLNVIHFVQNGFGVGYIGGNNGVLLKTYDSGTTWEAVNYTGINAAGPIHFKDLQFVDPDVGFATLEGTIGLYKTIDGGSTWIELDDPSMGAFCYRSTLHVIDENHFFVGGAGCFQSTMIFEYNNGVWSEKMDDHETFNAMHYVKDIQFRGNLGIASVNSDVILRSTDGGQNWNQVSTLIPDPSYHLTDIIIVNDTLVFAGHELYSGEYLWFQSNDAGATWWVAQPLGGDVIFYASWFAFKKGTNGYLYSSASQAAGPHYMHQMDLNSAWSYEMVNEKILSIDAYGNNYVYGVGENGYVIRNFPVVGVEGNENINISIFPNPGNEKITIEYPGQASFEITDANGRMIETLDVADQVTINVSNWQKGGYFVKSSNEGIVKKLIVN
jgi:photosystem II stability/assembly factor-like uncharacterized protein